MHKTLAAFISHLFLGLTRVLCVRPDIYVFLLYWDIYVSYIFSAAHISPLLIQLLRCLTYFKIRVLLTAVLLQILVVDVMIVWCLVFGVMRKITSAAAKALIQIWVAASIDGEMMSRRCDGKAGELKVLRVMIKVRWRWWRTMRATVSQATGAWCFIVIRHWSLSHICSWGDQFKPGDSAIKITLIFHHRDGNDRLWL